MANDSTILPYSLDDYFQTTPIGSLDKAIGNNLYGINHRQVPGMVSVNKDVYGLTFFVRPQLNMQAENIRNARIFAPLLTLDPKTIQHFVKCTLDPRLMEGYKFNQYTVPAITNPIVDNSNAFISILSNNLNSISGWPDIVSPTHTSKSGLYNESFSMVDGVTTFYETFDIEANFRNTRGDPILYMMYIWQRYASLVFEGRLVPYMDFITENEIDYNTRIYRLVLDQTKRIVRKIAATGAAFPISSPTGSFFDYNNDKPYNDQNKDISIRFKCMGAEYQDDILIKEFNQTVCIFNPAMSDTHRDKEMMLLTQSLASMFNNRGYPRINPKNNYLEWWVPKDLWNNRTTKFLEVSAAGSVAGINQDDEETGD